MKAPIFVFRQWQRHRTWSDNELSARYRDLPEEFYVPTPEQIGVQSASSKQSRDIVIMDEETRIARQHQISQTRRVMSGAFLQYKTLIGLGWPREFATSVLPVATYSHMFASVNLLNLLKFLTLRCDSPAQYEIRVYPEAILALIRPVVPVYVAAWEAPA